jgi:hypothetical protein
VTVPLGPHAVDAAPAARSYCPGCDQLVAIAGGAVVFGTIARSRTKEGVTIDQIKEQFAGVENRPAGAVSLVVFQSANDPREIWIASAFESRDAYFKNADSP